MSKHDKITEFNVFTPWLWPNARLSNLKVNPVYLSTEHQRGTIKGRKTRKKQIIIEEKQESRESSLKTGWNSHPFPLFTLRFGRVAGGSWRLHMVGGTVLILLLIFSGNFHLPRTVPSLLHSQQVPGTSGDPRVPAGVWVCAYVWSCRAFVLQVVGCGCAGIQIWVMWQCDTMGVVQWFASSSTWRTQITHIDVG